MSSVFSTSIISLLLLNHRFYQWNISSDHLSSTAIINLYPDKGKPSLPYPCFQSAFLHKHTNYTMLSQMWIRPLRAALNMEVRYNAWMFSRFGLSFLSHFTGNSTTSCWMWTFKPFSQICLQNSRTVIQCFHWLSGVPKERWHSAYT